MYAQVHMCLCETEYSPKSFCYDVLIFNFTTSPQNSIDTENVLLFSEEDNKYHRLAVVWDYLEQRQISLNTGFWILTVPLHYSRARFYL